MAWIDYRKAYDMVPHSWIVECMSMFKIAANVRTLMESSMENWKTEFNVFGRKPRKCKYKTRYFSRR